MQFSIKRVNALILRYFYTYASDLWKPINSVYWVCIEILIWVNVGGWLQSDASNSQFITKYFLISAIVWMPFTRSAYDVSLAVLREIQSYNLCNLFSSPLEFKEWLLSLTIFTSVVNVCIITFAFLFVKFFYSVDLFNLYIIPLLFIIFLSGVALGFFASGLIIYFGTKVEELIYMFPWSCAPFVGVYYALETLPQWMQYIGSALPMAYIFKYVHALVEGKDANLINIGIALILAIFYLIISALFFKFMFSRSKELGLSRLS
ncbi:hypothetical protein A3F66_04465 [candidate division TM6 bacterium RIFCSPHIGHO2_12_FULL_32_22]|nr:MAG: hypothetical protein A3F66_04465 [candidate division TM6 bacterium RIFCSPHIGHO2_12_FULL_32_22]